MMVKIIVKRDHPRIRGDNKVFTTSLLPETGSPPHTRGQRGAVDAKITKEGITPAYAGTTQAGRIRRDGHGITPAYAGTTSYAWIVALGFEDHPRIRGDNTLLKEIRWNLVGSPPHTRGQLFTQNSCDDSGRITPAYAGTTLMLLILMQKSRDHPRIRGDNGSTHL